MKAIRGLAAALLLLAAGCHTETLVDVRGDDAGPGMDKRGTVKLVPFHMNSIGTEVEFGPHPDCPEGTLRLIGAGTGIGTHIGKVTYALRHCADPNATPRRFFGGRARQFAANGDELWLDYEGYFVSPTQWEMTETIVGGTGRFEHATGTVMGYGDQMPDGNWSVYEVGEISTVGSSK